MRFLAILAAFVLVSLPAMAAELNPMIEVISDTNRAKPLQNPNLTRSDRILTRRVLDGKNKVVGSVQDVALHNSGSIAFLDVNFDRMKLGRPVFVNYSSTGMDPVTNGYAMKYDSNEIETLYPSLLANIETAGGEEDIHSLKKLRGNEVYNTSGRRIGTVGDVLFGNEGARAEVMYVTLTTGNLRGDGVGVPFNQTNISAVGGKQRVTISDQMADAMIAFAKEN